MTTLTMFPGAITTSSKTVYPAPQSGPSEGSAGLGATTSAGDSVFGQSDAPSVPAAFSVDFVTVALPEQAASAVAELSIELYVISTATWTEAIAVKSSAAIPSRSYDTFIRVGKDDGIGGFRIVQVAAGGTPSQLCQMVVGYRIL
jgi:hypothetical protein